MNHLALDIGGAALKGADGLGFADARHFALWQQADELAQELRTFIAGFPACDHLAVTMTGELADCFGTKAEGVRHILAAVDEAADGRHTRVYLVDGRMVTTAVARRKPELVAAANWHALAAFAGRLVPQGAALLIDIGSTTCDLIPLEDGRPAARGKSDTQRLLSRELIYTGVERSPVCAVVSNVPYRGQQCPVAQELFATMQDVYLILGVTAEDAANRFTVDARPATKGAARMRLGRCLCADAGEFNHRDAVAMAKSVAEAQLLRVVSGIDEVAHRMPDPPATVVLSGQGEFLARRALDRLRWKADVISLARRWGPLVSRCAPAHALAALAREARQR